MNESQVYNQLRDYQEWQIDALSQMISQGKHWIINQLSTGGGKTVEFSAITKRYTSKPNTNFRQNRVLILVHREELLLQTWRTLKEWYNIDAQTITQDTKHIYDKQCYVGMVETVYRRLLKQANYLPYIGLVIFDEAHLGNFRKLHQFFFDSFIIGFTATNISADKKAPLKDFFEDIVVGPQIKHLIEIKSLCQNVTYSVKGINRSLLKVKGNDFDETVMGNEFSKVRHVYNVIAKYEEVARGTKAIIYNCNIMHSTIVMNAFIEKGYPCKHVDGETQEDERRAIFKWFKETQGAILCNVGVATMGYDEPTVETIIINRSTKSLVLWLQMCGRGGRPIDLKFINERQYQYPYSLSLKDRFTIIDMGGNGKALGDWNDDRDWYKIFHNPPKKKDKLDAAPMKDCPNCEALIPIQCMICPQCGYMFPKREEEYDTVKNVELEIITKNIDVRKMMESNANKNIYYALFQVENNLLTQLKYKIGGRTLTQDHVDMILSKYLDKAKDWYIVKDNIIEWNDHEEMQFNLKHVPYIKKHLYERLEQMFNWKPNNIQNVSNISSISPII